MAFVKLTNKHSHFAGVLLPLLSKLVIKATETQEEYVRQTGRSLFDRQPYFDPLLLVEYFVAIEHKILDLSFKFSAKL